MKHFLFLTTLALVSCDSEASPVESLRLRASA